ncbi:MAG: hypothetical protein VXB67_08605 [Deltaproteobacteria bacterium]
MNQSKENSPSGSDLRKQSGLTQDQNLRDHHVDPIFTDAAIVQ